MRIMPGAMLGVLGGGQLGRMFVMAAQQMGYRVTVLDPLPDSPAGRTADDFICANYADQSALEKLSGQCAAITTEFENIPAESLQKLSVLVSSVRMHTVFPSHKTELLKNNFWVPMVLPLHPLRSYSSRRTLFTQNVRNYFRHSESQSVWLRWQGPEIRYGCNGTGSCLCATESFCLCAGKIHTVEKRTIGCGCSKRRWRIERLTRYPKISTSMAFSISVLFHRVISQELADQAHAIAWQDCGETGLSWCFVCRVFVSTLTNGELLINEIAPRPHNSGHYSLDACITSQFEQQVRTLCGLPLGETTQHTPATMVNVLGDLWHNGEPNWNHVLQHPSTKLHLYGKTEARPGRKMGHFTILNNSLEATLQQAITIKNSLNLNQNT